jgi:beta-mannosidase
MEIHNLSSLNWELVGTKPHYWRLWEQMDEMRIKHPENAPVTARVPGSVQQSLLDAGIIPDWNVGTNYRDIEWVENRHWIYFTDIPDNLFDTNRKAILRCKGLDGDGEVWLNGQKAGEFNNTHLDYRFDISPFLKTSGNRLALVFFCPERYQGQVYWTSKTRLNKPRFYYNWDWCPRIIQTGIYDEICIEIRDAVEIEQLYSYTDVDIDTTTGKLQLKAEFSAEITNETIKICLKGTDDVCIFNKTFPAKNFSESVEIEIPNILIWEPNGVGKQPLYTLSCSLVSEHGAEVQSITRNLGFRSIKWLRCENALPEADPWILNVNGKSIFMQGVNWTPVRTMFADVTCEMYREWLLKYKNMGANILRVWGGATLEKACFYELCDELGLMVWQEFPLSSSGICNTPPDDAESEELMAQIVESYIRRRHFHTSLIAWSGGNELYNKENTQPLDFSHPLLAKAKEVCEKLDMHHRIMPTSPSGPTIYYNPELNGKGIQWDVHGPWWLPFEQTDSEFSNIRAYWESSDALFHSEAGVPGASSVELIERYRGNYPVLPVSVDNPIWGQFSWWIEADKFELEMGYTPKNISEYIEWQQNRQTKGLAIAIEAAKKRFPACGGFIIWMGHDCFPCTANTSIFDYDGNAKPVVAEIEKIWKRKV